MKAALMLGAILLAWTSASGEPVPHDGWLIDAAAPMCDCLACHNGSGASKIGDCADATTLYNRHPVGVPYPPGNGGLAYAGLAEVTAKGLTFDNGQITCRTCHDLESTNDFRLALPTPELCRTCHHRH